MPYEGADYKTKKRNAELENSTNFLLEEYANIAAVVFANAETPDDLLVLANAFFTNHQGNNSLRLSPESLQQGNIECTSAAILLAMAWCLLTDLEAYCLIEKRLLYEPAGNGNYDTGSSLAHSLVALPLSPDVTLAEVEATYYALRKVRTKEELPSTRVAFLEYQRNLAKQKNEFRTVVPHDVPVVDVYSNVRQFVKSQLVRFGTKNISRKASDQSENYEVVHGDHLRSNRLATKVRGAIQTAMKMGLAVEGDFRDVSQVSITNNVSAWKQLPVKPVVLQDRDTYQTVTLFNQLPIRGA